MTSSIAGLASIALILAGLACLLIGPAIAFVLRWIFGVLLALAALGVVLVIAVMYLLSHVATVSEGNHAPAMPEVWTAAILGCSVLALALWRGRRVSPPSLARRVSPRTLADMASTETLHPPSLGPLPFAAAAPRFTSRPAPRLATVSPCPAQVSPAAGDAILALVGLGFSKADAATSVASAVTVLGPQASLPALIKAALRRAA